MTEIFTTQPGLPDEWIRKLKANDEQALKALYAANYSKVENYVLDNSGSAEDAKDIYQEAFIAVWRNIQLDKISFTNPDKLQGYLFRVAQYKWLDQLRSSKRQKISSLDSIAGEAGPYMDTEENEYLEKVKSNYAALGEPCRDVLYRFYFLKHKLNEIAAFFSWTEATAKNNKYRCLQRLRNMILPQKTIPEIQNTISPEEFERIERFLSHDMPEEEAQAFAQSLATDIALREKTEEIKLLLLGIQESSLEERLGRFHKEITPVTGSKKNTRVIPLGRRLLVAASYW